jgi:hypothetical protein
MSKTQEYKSWKFEKSGDYYTDLAMKESTNRLTAINPKRDIGLYQFGEMALVDAGYYKKDLQPGQKKKNLYNHDWQTWYK